MLQANKSKEKQCVKVEKDVIRKKVTERDIEKWEVAQLDFNIEPRSKPSTLFERLEEKRKIKHENLLQQLARDLFEVNQKTEKNITISSQELKAHCKDFSNSLNEILNSIDKPEVVSYCDSVFMNLQCQVNVFKKKQQSLVDELHQDLIKFEDERTKENERILSVACEEIRKIGYFLPYEVQTFVEHEALKMNKLSLNNRRCYEDLRLTMTLITEQTFKSFMDKVFCIRESWFRHKKQESSYNLPAIVENKICKVLPEEYIRNDVKGNELFLRRGPGNLYHTCKGDEWLENVEKGLEILNSHTQNLAQVYKKLVSAIYKGFDEETGEIIQEATSLESIIIVERVLKPIMFSEPLQEVKLFEDMELHWQDILSDVQRNYSKMLYFIEVLGELWQRHKDRICESKKLIFKVLEKADAENQGILEDLEVKVNMGLDVLRQEHNEAKLEKAYEAVVATLNLLKAKYESMYLEEVSTVEDFYKMVELEADVLAADIQQFIFEDHFLDYEKLFHFHCDSIRYLPEGKPILKDMELCSYKLQALKSYKQGILVALETMSWKGKEALAARAEKWISMKIESFAEKKSVQLELLDKRFQRVRVEIYEKRLSEINSHDELFAEHKKKIQFVLQKLKDEFENLIERESAKLNYVKENLDEIEQNALFENLPGVIRGNKIMMDKKKEELESDLKMAFERFRAECNTKIFDMQQTNIRFMKSIKLFHEGGNYSSEEGKMYITMLEAVDKEISAELKNMLKESTKEEADFVKKVSAMFSPVITLFGNLYEETLFKHEVQVRLRNFADDIREIAKILKSDFEFLTDQCRCLCMSLNNSKFQTDDDEKVWNFIIELLYRNVRHLLYPVNVPESPVQSESTESQEGETDSPCCCAGKFSVNLPTSKTTLLRSSERERPFACKDYRKEFLNCDNPPENNGTLMSATCSHFWEEMDFMQRTACDFYKKVQTRKILREDLIPTNYDTFVTEILTKLKYYNIQIQQFWLQLVLDFLPLIGRIKMLANSFLERKLDYYNLAAHRALQDFHENFANCLETQMCENVNELQNLDSKLLPLHGYPNNADLLSGLEEEVVRKTANQEIQWEASIKKFKNELKCFRVHHTIQKVEISKIEIIYNKFRNTIFVEDLSNNLLDEILSYCDNGGFCMKKMSTLSLAVDKDGDGEGESLASGEVPDEHKLDIVPSKKNLHSVQTYLRKLKQIIDWERSSENKPSFCPSCPEDSEGSFHGEAICEEYCQKKLNILLEIADFEVPVGKILESLDLNIRKLKTFAKSQEQAHETELYKWLEKWKYNVKKILKLYSVTNEEKEETPEEKPPHQSENSKPKTEKTSASVTSTFPRLCPTTELDLKDTSCNSQKVKSQSQGSSQVSNEIKEDPGVVKPSTTHSHKSKVTETEGFTTFVISPRNYHGQIPVLSRHSLYFSRMSPPDTRSPSPLKKVTLKEKSANKIKTITLEDSKKKSKSQNSRSPSPAKRITGSYKKATSASSGQSRNSEKLAAAKYADSSKQTSPRVNSPTKRKSKIFSSNNVDYSVKSKSGKELQRPDGDANPMVLKQTSHPSLYVNEKIIQPQEKISLDHIKNEVFTGDHRRLSLEKVHLCIEKTVENFNFPERKRSYLVTYSSEDLKKQEEISLSFLKNMSSTTLANPKTDMDQRRITDEVKESQSAIRTLSGHELILTPSMKLEIDKEEADGLEISQILQSQEETFDDKTDIHILQDDENEYDSEVTTDDEMAKNRGQSFHSRHSNDLQNANSLWKSREKDLLNDVDYRQSVYHPAVCRRQNTDTGEMEYRPKSKSIEDNFGFPNKTGKRIVRTRSSHLNNKYAAQCFTMYKLDSSNDCSNDRSWDPSFDKTDERPTYNSVIQDAPFYGTKRIRTKKERISGAFLRFTLKMIRLLAIFNLWPGDNCYMLTSQSLRFAR